MKLMHNRAPGVFLVLALAATLQAAVPCPSPRDVTPGATLEDIAGQSLGSPVYFISIALATNARTGDGFSYIANPDNLSGVSRVCVPGKTEANHLLRSWEVYERAVAAARLPRISAVDKGLVTIPEDQRVNVVAWVRKDQADRLKTANGQFVNTAPSETWVTVEPHLQEFCRAFVRDHKADEARLTERLEQRLGLSPASSKVSFVRIRLNHPDSTVIFRPCVNSAASQTDCSVGPPSKAPPDYQLWFYRQYYSSYGQSLISEFPWTALGYTFDWAPTGDKKTPFPRFGESEFVIRANAPIDIQDVVETSKYCEQAPQP